MTQYGHTITPGGQLSSLLGLLLADVGLLPLTSAALVIAGADLEAVIGPALEGALGVDLDIGPDGCFKTFDVVDDGSGDSCLALGGGETIRSIRRASGAAVLSTFFPVTAGCIGRIRAKFRRLSSAVVASRRLMSSHESVSEDAGRDDSAAGL